MFEIDSKSRIELRDCQLKVDYEEINENEATQSLQTLGLYVQEIEESTSLPAGTVSINSCSFFGFSLPIVCETPSQLSVIKSSFIKSLGRCIAVLNPIHLIIEDCSFESVADSAIEVQFDPCANVSPGPKTIKISHNFITDSLSFGISLASVKPYSSPMDYDTMICDNQIQNPKKEGIYLVNVKISKLTLLSNMVTDSERNGITLLGTSCPSLILNHNLLRQCTGAGISIIESSCSIVNCECSFNMLSGISIVGSPNISGKSEEKGKTIEIFECGIKSNKQHGISVFDFINGAILIRKCVTEKNGENGVWLFCSDPFSGIMNQSLSTSTVAPAPLSESKVCIESSEIKYNKGSGIHLSQQLLALDGVMIRGNELFAIHLPTKNDEKFLKVSKVITSKNKIEGLVGGKWGKSKVHYTKWLACCEHLCKII